MCHDSNVPERRVVRLLCCVAIGYMLLPKVYKISEATVRTLLLQALKTTAHTFFSWSRSSFRASFPECGSVALVFD